MTWHGSIFFSTMLRTYGNTFFFQFHHIRSLDLKTKNCRITRYFLQTGTKQYQHFCKTRVFIFWVGHFTFLGIKLREASHFEPPRGTQSQVDQGDETLRTPAFATHIWLVPHVPVRSWLRRGWPGGQDAPIKTDLFEIDLATSSTILFHSRCGLMNKILQTSVYTSLLNGQFHTISQPV